MMTRRFLMPLLAGSLVAALGAALPVVHAQEGADPKPTLSREQLRERQQERLESGASIYGTSLMTRKERTEHREKLRSLSNRADKLAYLEQHRIRMQERARERNTWLPGMPRPAGSAKPAGGGGDNRP